MSPFRSMIAEGWPSTTCSITAADAVYHGHAQDGDNPQDMVRKIAGWLEDVIARPQAQAQQDIIHREISHSLFQAILGSNLIEGAGLDLDITMELCQEIFDAEGLDAGAAQDSRYEKKVIDYYHRRMGRQGETRTTQSLTRGCREVVQHVRAYQHILDEFVTMKHDLSEELIKETHRILTLGVPIIHRDNTTTPPEKYGGIYRTVVVGAGACNFSTPRFVPVHMADLCQNLKEDIASTERNQSIDPISMASKYSLGFVEIHPFQDGNGRMCRMILNAILCRYLGVIVPIGEHEDERKEYMAIKVRASEECEGHGAYANFVLKRAVRKVRTLKKKLTGKHNV